MSEYLTYRFEDTPAFVSTFDELPLWSAAFGLLLLKHLDVKAGLTVLDLGSGTGFPLLELAGRLGHSCRLYGIDPWAHANERARQKIRNYGLRNVEIIESSAEHLPFDDASVDLIVSNLGLNNFTNVRTVLLECFRVLKPGGKVALTTNVNGHWQEFYDLFSRTLQQLNKEDILKKLEEQQAHRGSLESISQLLTNSGLAINRTYTDQLEMKFLDGTAFLNHHFVKLGWITEWIQLVAPEEREATFGLLEQNLNDFARNNDGLRLSVPMAFIEATKA